MSDLKNDILEQRLVAQKRQNRWRERRVVLPQGPTRIQYQNKNFLSFSSNDYLDLATHPEIINTLTQSAKQYGLGSKASALVAGYTKAHQELENAFADFTGRDRAIFFGNGTLANLGIINALMQDRYDTIYQDKLNHASLIDAALLSKAQLQRYPHGDYEFLQKALQKNEAGLKLIVSESVFSMDGTQSDLNKLSELAQHSAALLMIDDSHGFGVLGKEGKSVAGQLSQHECPLIMCSLGKAFGAYGALVAGSELIIENILQFARSYTYTTAAPPALAAAANKALQLIQTEEWRREKLQELIHHFKKRAKELNLNILDSNTPIQGIIIGDAIKAQQLSQNLLEKGFYIRDIRPPTVPVGTARLRISLNTSHSLKDIDQLIEALQ